MIATILLPIASIVSVAVIVVVIRFIVGTRRQK